MYEKNIINRMNTKSKKSLKEKEDMQEKYTTYINYIIRLNEIYIQSKESKKEEFNEPVEKEKVRIKSEKIRESIDKYTLSDDNNED